MLIRILRTSAERHVERDLGVVLIESGLAEEVVKENIPGPQPAPPVCAMVWNVSKTTEGLPQVTAHCAAHRISSRYLVDQWEPFRRKEGGGIAKDFVIWHAGRAERPPKWALDEIAAFGDIDGTFVAERPPLSFLQASGHDAIDRSTIATGSRPSDYAAVQLLKLPPRAEG